MTTFALSQEDAQAWTKWRKELMGRLTTQVKTGAYCYHHPTHPSTVFVTHDLDILTLK